MVAHPREVRVALCIIAATLGVGCWGHHARWEEAAPDGTGVTLEVRLASTGGGPWYAGVVRVFPDGSFDAADRFELRVCTGTLDPSLLSEAEALIRETQPFELPPWLGRDCHHCELVSVRLVSEGGLANDVRGTLAPALEPYRAFAERVWAETDFDACPSPPLSPEETELVLWVDATTPSIAVRDSYTGFSALRLELRSGARLLRIERYEAFSSDGDEPTPLCALEISADERERLLDAIQRAALHAEPAMCDTDDVRSLTDLRVTVNLRTRVPAYERTSLLRNVSFRVCDDHHESHREVEDAVRVLLDRCG